jgi:hypothetical protein
VHVPTGAGRSAQFLARRRTGPAIDGDKPDSCLDEPPRQQQVLPQGMPAVAVADGCRLAGHLEGLAAARLDGQLKGPLVYVLPFIGYSIARAGPCGEIQAVQQPAPFLHALGLRRREQIGSFETGHGGMVVGRADEQRAVDGTQVAARANIRGAKDGIADALDEPDVGGGVALAGPNFGQYGTDIRRVGRRTSLAAQEVVHRVEMVADVVDMRHRADQRKMLGQLGQARVKFADAHTGHGGGNRPIRAPNSLRRCGLQVPRIEMTGPATQQDEDARLRGSTAAQCLFAIDARRNHARKGPMKNADAAGLEQLAARDHSGRLPLGAR